MTSARIMNLLPSKSTCKSTLLTAAFVTVHVAAYLDREQDNESSSVITFSLTSKIVASLHTAYAFYEVLENFERAGQYFNPSKYKLASAGALVTSLGTLAGVWAVGDSRANLILGVSNAGSNFFGRLFSAAHRKAVMSELIVSFDGLETPATATPPLPATQTEPDLESGNAYRSMSPTGF
jgi:hypothetical protein